MSNPILQVLSPLADEEVEASGGAEGTDQPMGYIAQFTKAVKFYQQKIEVVSGVGVLTILCGIA